MKRILSLALCVIMALLSLAACGEKDRTLYKSGLKKYVDLGEFKGIEIDTKSDEYAKAYEATVNSDVENHKFYEKKTEGKVAKGDTANIDYVGKKDGVAFDGGTAQGYDLTIGSGSFINGFEDGLIGVEIGSTVDLNLTFPENYGNDELNGAKVVFTVKVNYVTTTTPLTPDKFYGELKFANVQEYEKDAKERTVKDMLLSKLNESSKIKDYPQEDLDLLYNSAKDIFVQNVESYGYTFETYISTTGTTEEKFKEELITNSVKPMMDNQMLLYYVFDEADLEFNQNEIAAEAQEIADEIGNGVTVEKVKEYYGEHSLEYYVISEKALQYMYDNAKIK